MQAKMEDVGRPLSSPPMISNYSLYKLIKCPQDLKLRIHKFFLSMKSCTLLIVQVVEVGLPCTYVLVAPKHQQSSQTPTKARGFVRNGFMVFFHGIQSYGRLEINGFLPGC